MGTERGPEYYTGDGYIKGNRFKRYFKLYEQVINYLPSSNFCPTIVDLGCGAGFFAEMLSKKNYKNYIGIDFSKEVISKAINRVSDYKFICSNLLDVNILKLYESDMIFVCLEVLEHITKDIEVLKSIPKRSTIICSVPNRDFASHVRYFATVELVVDRYKEVVDFESMQVILMNHKKNSKIFLFKGIIK